MRSTKSLSWTKRLAGLDPLVVPPHVFSVRPDQLAYARFATLDVQPELAAWETTEIDEGTFGEGPLAGPIHDAAPMRELMDALVGQVVPPIQEASLILPDSWLRISFAEVEGLPRNAAERDAILRWKLQRLVPFRIEDLRLDAGQLSSTRSETGSQPVMIGFGVEVLLQQLEDLFAGAGIRIGQITNESLSLLNAVTNVLRDVELGAVVSISRSSYALIFTYRGEPVLHRRKELGPEAEAGLDEQLVLRDLRLTRGFLEERLQSPRIGRFVIAGAGDRTEDWSSWLESVFNYPVVALGKQHLGFENIPEDLPVHRLAALLGAALQVVD